MDYDLRLALMCGTDIPIPECQIQIHQPTIKEIALIGETDFFLGIQTINVTKEILKGEDETLLSNTSNFQIFMTIMQEKEAQDKKEAVKQLLLLILPKYQVTFTPRSLVIMQDENSITIDDKNFEALQKVLSQVFCIDNSKANVQTFNPGNAKAKEIADKLMRARQRVAAQKGSEGSIFAQYISTLTVGLGSMSFEDCLNLTMYQLFDLVERYMLYVNWDLDIKSRLAGAKVEKQPDNWMKNIH